MTELLADSFKIVGVQRRRVHEAGHLSRIDRHRA